VIPLLHDFSGTTVLVVGGGSVGARKAGRFAREARVVAVSPTFDEAFAGVDAERVRAAPGPDEVGGWVERANPALVVAATDDAAVNEAAARAAREAGALVNRADVAGERDPGSVVVPATVRDGPVVAAVATGGRAPALSRYLREQVEAELAGAGELATVAADLRADLKNREIPPDQRRAALRAVVESPSVWKALRTVNDNPRREAVAAAEDALPDAGRRSQS
jgi:precorrin-2 dehydrogenase/sirohydrochlorin ferrochelatase